MVEMYMRKVLYEKNMRKVCTFIKNLRKVLFKWRSWGKMCLTGSHSWYNNQVIMRKVFYKFLKWQIIFPYNFTLLSASPQVWKRTVLQIKIQPKKYSYALTTYFLKKYLKFSKWTLNVSDIKDLSCRISGLWDRSCATLFPS